MVTNQKCLSDTQKIKLVSSSLEVGQVYRMRLDHEEGVKGKSEGDNGRNKYFIIIGIEDGVAIGVVLINSHINEGLEQCLKDLHYPLKVFDYSFLEKNRFAYCGELKSIPISKFIKKFDPPKGNINTSDLEYIKDAVISSPKLTPKELKRFGLIE